MTRDLHAAFPRLHLKAWTAVEIDHFAQSTKRPVRSILEDLIAAGLGSMPGGGAEIFDPQVRTQICPRKADAQTWLAIHRTAHQLGLRTNASMLYGHIESIEHRVDHLVQLRHLQDETGGFQAFVPLAFHPEHTAMSHLRRVSALDRPARRGRQPADARQLRSHQGVLDFAGRGHAADGAGAMGRTISTARCATSASTTRPAPLRPKPSRSTSSAR